MAIRNRPIPPSRIIPGSQWPAAQDVFTWLANTGLPTGQSNHGLQVVLGQTTGFNTIVDISAPGALVWLIVAGYNNNPSINLDFGVRITIDGRVVLNTTRQILPQNDNAFTVVGHIGFGFGASAPIRGAAADYVVFDKNLAIEIYKGTGEVDVIGAFKYQIT